MQKRTINRGIAGGIAGEFIGGPVGEYLGSGLGGFAGGRLGYKIGQKLSPADLTRDQMIGNSVSKRPASAPRSIWSRIAGFFRKLTLRAA